MQLHSPLPPSALAKSVTAIISDIAVFIFMAWAVFRQWQAHRRLKRLEKKLKDYGPMLSDDAEAVQEIARAHPFILSYDHAWRIAAAIDLCQARKRRDALDRMTADVYGPGGLAGCCRDVWTRLQDWRRRP